VAAIVELHTQRGQGRTRHLRHSDDRPGTPWHRRLAAGVAGGRVVPGA
jgi:hypothetical protein